MDRVVGVLGGGQLGRMLTEAANRLNIKIVTLDAENAPAKQINATAPHINGSFADRDAVCQLAELCDVMTVEIEHVNTDVLEDLSRGIKTGDDWRTVRSKQREIQPSWRTIRTIQDKFHQKEHLQARQIPTASSIALEEPTGSQELEAIGQQLGYPFMLKSRTEAYDGRGNYPVKSTENIPSAISALQNRPLYAEKWANFRIELAVMVVKTKDDADLDWQQSTIAYPVVETVHEDSICKLVYAPARGVPTSVLENTQELARRAVATFWGRGVFGVEMFWLGDDEILVNEIAPRPHNSGHYTIEACALSQYDAHLRAILGLPILEESMCLIGSTTNAIMLNILGGLEPTSHRTMAERALAVPGASIHLYGKGDARPGRKMGHVTLVADSMDEAASRMKPLISLADHIRTEKLKARSEPTQKGVRKSDGQTQRESPMKGRSPLVAVTMGSKSDSSVLAPGIKVLEQLGVPFTATITSAHRTPEKMVKFAQESAGKGIKVIIAAAGGAAHLPGMIAANTWLPVIGVPVKGSVLDGQDSLLSIVQMPVRQICFTCSNPIVDLGLASADPPQRGCPVATVAINNSINAAQLAVRILATSEINAEIRKRLEQHLADQTTSVLEDSIKMERVGFEAFCSQG
ncbi:MAG: hypothetical protein LQ352_004197 [Teloschistes flavicans]|nr:MAG: hypothetical protein LQ352_004197 [Teloschistes flavicans]